MKKETAIQMTESELGIAKDKYMEVQCKRLSKKSYNRALINAHIRNFISELMKDTYYHVEDDE